MKRYDVYFLQQKFGLTWETLERAQSPTVLVSGLVDRYQQGATDELRVVAGQWDDVAEQWQYSQIFFVDPNAIDLALGEAGQDLTPSDDRGPLGVSPEQSDTGPDNGVSVLDEILRNADRDQEPSETGDYDDTVRRDVVDEDRSDEDFAAAVHRASRDADESEHEADDGPFGFRERFSDDQDDDLDPPPAFVAPKPRSRARPGLIIGLILLVLILTLAGLITLMVALDRPEIRPYVSQVQALFEEHFQDTASEPDMGVQPETSGQVLRFTGVAPGLRGRWSPGNCEASYLEFDEDGYIVQVPNQDPSIEIPVLETLIDDYTFFVRRSPELVEHYQRLGETEIQLVGYTGLSGFDRATSDILNRCP